MDRVLAALEGGDGLIRVADQPRLRASIYRLAASGELAPVLPGIFARPGGIDTETWLRALCLWCPSGVVHDRTAVALWLGEPVTSVHLAVATRREPPRGVTLLRHRIPPEFVVGRGGLRVATLAYAAVEVAAKDEGRAIMAGLRERRMATDELAPALTALACCPDQSRRTRIVRAALRNPWSYAEAILQRILLEAGIDGWIANGRLRFSGTWYYPDICFPEARLVLEFDGYAEHSKRESFGPDRERQNAFVLARYRVLRFTWEHLTERPEYVVATVRAALRG